MKSVLPGIVLFGIALPLWGASFYPVRLQDAKAVYLTKDSFPVHGDGEADDSAAIQSAIDQVVATHREGIVFVPTGRYRVTRTIYVWRGVRVIGYGASRPVFVLADNTPGYQQGLGYMFFFTGPGPGKDSSRSLPGNEVPAMEGTVPPNNNTGPDALAGTFYSAMSNVDFEIGSGDAGAVCIRFHVEQHSYLAHIDFHIGSGLAALKDVGNEAEDLHFYGGQYGIITVKTSPGWQFTLLDSTFEGQREAAIREHEVGLTLVHDIFRNVPQAISIDAGYADELWAEDTRLENISGPAITISNENNARTEINLENIACRNVSIFALLRESGRKIAGPGENYRVKAFSHGLTMSAPADVGGIKTNFDAEALKQLPPPAGNAITVLPPADTWVNLQSLGAKGDGVTDDTAAIQKAIAEHRALYVPMGRYLVSASILLRPDTVLIGLHPSRTQFDLADGTKEFQGPGAPRPLLEAPQGGHNIVTGIGISTGDDNPRAVGVLWKAGADSLIDDVRFIGGHGTTGPNGERINPYAGGPSFNPNWDKQYASLWIADGGGGTFADIWTPSTFAQAGLYISNTTTPGHIYELSCEHHVRNEVMLDQVENWNLVALQTEEESLESAFALPLEISRSKNITVANYFAYRVTAVSQPFPYAVNVSESRDIRFRNMHVYSGGKFPFDNSVLDATNHAELRAREFAWLDVPGTPVSSGQRGPSPALEPAAQVKRLATGFSDISGAAVDAAGKLYFVDVRWQRIYRWSPETGEAVVVRNAPLDPVNLAFDKGGDLLVVSRGGKGTIYSFRPEEPANQITMLEPQPAQERPGMTALYASGVQAIEGLSQQRPWQYISPDHSVFIPAGNDFVQGLITRRIKKADILLAPGLAQAMPARPVYVTDGHEEKTYKGNVTATGTIGDMKLFAEEGGESLTQDEEGNVYLAAGQVLVYSPGGKQVERIDIPERPIDLVFGGEDRSTLYILTHTSLYAVRTRVPGL
ncbi:MAG TPA: glycosyl hydrolase family 28-related protein [Terriglobales bacterium]|jgi:sugar lactone lactonase YvrE|nr:glycosyl hydrolase family 28-related protein [Terriglobales bacterium]